VAEFVTVSLGITTITPAPEMASSVLIQIADEGLYQAKERGRDQWVLKLPEKR
jgi:PleD family two-component response regulator